MNYFYTGNSVQSAQWVLPSLLYFFEVPPFAISFMVPCMTHVHSDLDFLECVDALLALMVGRTQQPECQKQPIARGPLSYYTLTHCSFPLFLSYVGRRCVEPNGCVPAFNKLPWEDPSGIHDVRNDGTHRGAHNREQVRSFAHLCGGSVGQSCVELRTWFDVP